MIITGIITLVTAGLFWQVSRGTISYFLFMYMFASRLFFPDSPTSAKFLNENERAQAVQRIRVNRTGIENKHFKLPQYALVPV